MCISPKVFTPVKGPALLPVKDMVNDQDYLAKLRQSNQNVENLRQQRLNTFLENQPEFQHEIELGQMRYPFHIIELKQALNKLVPEEILKISSTSLPLIEDLASCSRILDYPVQSLRHRKQFFLYVTRPAFDVSAETPGCVIKLNPEKTEHHLVTALAV